MDLNDIKITPQGDTLIIREGQAATQLDPYDYQGFQYTATDVQSFCALVTAKCSPADAVVFSNGEGFQAILNDKIIDRRQDTVKMPYTYSIQMEEWKPVLENGETFTVKGLVDYIKRADPASIENFEILLDAFKNFRYVSSISGDFSYDNRNNYTFSVKMKDAEGTVRIPQSFMANIEIYKDSDWFQWMEIEVEIYKPKEAGEQPVFLLSCPKFERYKETAQEELFDTMKASLKDLLVVHGSPK